MRRCNVVTPRTADPDAAEPTPAADRVRLAALVAGLGAAVLVEDEHRRIALVNDEFCSMFAVPATPAALAGADCSGAAEQSKLLFADPPGFLRRVDEILGGGVAVRGDLLRMADGRVLERDFTPLAHDGASVGNVWVYRDVTARERQAARLDHSDRTATELLAILADPGVPLADRQTRLLAACCDLLDLEIGMISRHDGDGAEVLAARDPQGIIVPGLRVPLSATYATLREGHPDPVTFLRASGTPRAELPVFRTYGQEAYVGVPILVDERPSGTLAFSSRTPRTEPFDERAVNLVRLMALWIGSDRSRRRAEAELREADRMKSEFLAMISHEIRTPMNGVVGAADLLTGSPLRTDQRDLVQMVQQSAHALLAIVDDILETTKIEAGRIDLTLEPFDLRDVVEGAAQVAGADARAKNLVLTTSLDADVPPGLLGDRGRLRQILVNLVSNAVKFTDAGEIVVAAHLAGRRDDAVTLELEVTDTGVGIPASAQGKLFQPFSQVDATTTRRHGGTGLGLVISDRLARLMGGGVTLESEPGRGTRMIVRVDVALDPDAAEPARPLDGRRVVVRGPAPRATAALALTLAGLGADVVTDPDTADAAVVLPGDTALLWPGFPRVVIGEDLVLPARSQRLAETLLGALGAPEQTNAAVPTDRPAATGTRILVAEDNDVNRMLMTAQLERLGLSADVVRSGLEAVDAASRRDYPLILMDLRMPELDGFDATRAIRAAETGRRVPIVAVTANAAQADREACLDAGMDGHLAKPVTLEALRDVVARWLAPGALPR